MSVISSPYLNSSGTAIEKDGLVYLPFVDLNKPFLFHRLSIIGREGFVLEIRAPNLMRSPEECFVPGRSFATFIMEVLIARFGLEGGKIIAVNGLRFEKTYWKFPITKRNTEIVFNLLKELKVCIAEYKIKEDIHLDSSNESVKLLAAPAGHKLNSYSIAYKQFIFLDQGFGKQNEFYYNDSVLRTFAMNFVNKLSQLIVFEKR